MARNNYRIIILGLVALLLNACATTPRTTLYLDGGQSTVGVVLAHGRNKHPAWLVVDPLRKGIHERLGYHTISLQMPAGLSDFRDYAATFPDAYDRIESAIRFLKKEKGVTRVYLIGHSMGGRMSSAFVADNAEHGLAGLIVAGCRNNGGVPFSCLASLRGKNIPVLDIWGGNDKQDISAAAERKVLLSSLYTQTEIPGANHRFEGQEQALLDAVVNWLQAQP